MQAALPITIGSEGSFSTALTPLLHKLEMWINYHALKANWYADESCRLCFEFKLIRTLDEKAVLLRTEQWVLSSGYAYQHDSTTHKTSAFICIADIVKHGTGIEKAIKGRLTAVSNIVALQYGLAPIA